MSASPTHVTSVGPRTVCKALMITYASVGQATQASITISLVAVSISLPAHRRCALPPPPVLVNCL